MTQIQSYFFAAHCKLALFSLETIFIKKLICLILAHKLLRHYLKINSIDSSAVSENNLEVLTNLINPGRCESLKIVNLILTIIFRKLEIGNTNNQKNKIVSVLLTCV